MLSFLIIAFIIVFICLLFSQATKGPENVNKTKADLQVQAEAEKRAQEHTLFNTPIESAGLDFFFDCHPALMNSEFVVIDFETATQMPMSVVSLGITTFNKGNAVTREWLFKPYRTKEFEFTYLHGITPEMVADKPQFHESWPEIEPYLKGKILVAHNANFDLGILSNLIERRFLCKDFNIRYICTLELSRSMLKKYGYSCSLENLCSLYQIPHGKHNGGRDSISTLLLLNKLFYEEYRADSYYARILKGKKYGTWTVTKTISLNQSTNQT